MRVRWILSTLLLVGCSRRGEAEGRVAANDPKPEASKGSAQKAEVTPAPARKAEEILRANEGAANGAEIPFTHQG